MMLFNNVQKFSDKFNLWFFQSLNMGFGFFILFASSIFGAFLATDVERSFLFDQGQNHQLSWFFLLSKSAHAHSNLFGMIHILYGLSLAYVPYLPKWIVFCETISLALGTLSMGVLLFLKGQISHHGFLWDTIGLLLGMGLTPSLFVLFFHSYCFFKHALSKS